MFVCVCVCQPCTRWHTGQDVCVCVFVCVCVCVCVCSCVCMTGESGFSCSRPGGIQGAFRSRHCVELFNTTQHVFPPNTACTTRHASCETRVDSEAVCYVLQAGGFVTPFAVLGGIMVCTVPINMCVLPHLDGESERASARAQWCLHMNQHMSVRVRLRSGICACVCTVESARASAQ